MKEMKRKNIFTPTLIILCVILALYTVVLIAPLLWALYTSFMDVGKYSLGLDFFEELSYALSFDNFTIDNFVLMLTEFKIRPHTPGSKDAYLVHMFINSFLYAGGCGIIATIVPCVMAYLVARYNYWFGKIVYGIVLITMAIPIVGALPSEMRMVANIGLEDSLLGLFVLKANFLGIYFLVFHAQFKSIPMDYTEAAELDGASDWYVMSRIILPISSGTIVTVILLNFIAFWNDYQVPMMYWPSRPVLAYGLFRITEDHTGGKGTTPLNVAAMMMVAIPLLLLFAAFNKKIMSNMSIGGVKG